MATSVWVWVKLESGSHSFWHMWRVLESTWPLDVTSAASLVFCFLFNVTWNLAHLLCKEIVNSRNMRDSCTSCTNAKKREFPLCMLWKMHKIGRFCRCALKRKHSIWSKFAFYKLWSVYMINFLKQSKTLEDNICRWFSVKPFEMCFSFLKYSF